MVSRLEALEELQDFLGEFRPERFLSIMRSIYERPEEQQVPVHLADIIAKAKAYATASQELILEVVVAIAVERGGAN